MDDEKKLVEDLTNSEYKWGFVTDIEADEAPKGLNEEIIRFISTKKHEPCDSSKIKKTVENQRFF